MHIQAFQRSMSLVLVTLVLALVGCGEKADYSGSGDLDKAQAAPAATPNPPTGGGSVGGSPPVSVPTQERPSGG